MPTPYAIANWKMNLPPEGIESYVGAVRGAGGPSRLVIAPPFPYLGLDGVEVAAQNCAAEASGAFTGEVAATMVRAAGARYVIAGHSERRKLFGETDDVVAAKLRQAIGAGLVPVLCVGEDEATQDAGRSEEFVGTQLDAVAEAVSGASEVIVAYEPIWAIGTGKNADAATVAEMIAHIVATIGASWPKGLAGAVPILYGGSVTPENAADLAGNGRIDGFLIGGASLVSSKFLAIKTALDRAAESGNNSPPWQV